MRVVSTIVLYGALLTVVVLYPFDFSSIYSVPFGVFGHVSHCLIRNHYLR